MSPDKRMEDPVLGSPASKGWGREKPAKETDRESEMEAEGLGEFGVLEAWKREGVRGGSDHLC